MTFHPDGTITDGNAVLVATITATRREGVDYSSAIEEYHRDKDIGTIMRQRTSVCG